MTRDEVLALPAGRALDALVAEQVMGYKSPVGPDKYTWQHPSGYRGSVDMIPSFSTSIAAAWTVVEKMRTLGFSMDLRTVRDGYVAEYHWVDENSVVDPDRWDIGTSAVSMPEAICRAALSATTPTTPGDGEREKTR